MRFTCLLVFLVISPGSILAETVDFEFQSSNSKKYRTTTLIADLKRHYGIEFISEKVLLIETPYLSNLQYVTQRDQLTRLGHKAEEFLVMFVVACQNEESKHGYHTTIEEARKLSNGQSLFRVRLLDSKGVVMHKSTQPVLENRLIKWLEN